MTGADGSNETDVTAATKTKLKVVGLETSRLERRVAERWGQTEETLVSDGGVSEPEQ